jgi:anti-anti-sigma factor
MRISVEIREFCGIASIRLSGDLTADAVQEVEDLFSRLGDHGAHRVLLDFANVRVVEAQAVPILVGIVVALRTRGGELRIVNAKEDVVKLLGHRRLRRFFGVSTTVEEAVSTLAEHDLCRRQRLQQQALVAGGA